MSSEKHERQCAVVLGMHRSGTSALSGVLAHLGCGTPRSMAPADENNQRGYFESIPFWRLSEDILEAAGSKWDDWRPVPPEALTSEQWAAFAKRAQWVLNYEFQDQPLFVLKDPRMCRLLPFWLPEIETFGCQAHFVLTFRHPMEVAASLARRDGLEPEYGLLIWLHYVLQAERATRGVKRFFTSYDNVLTDWRRVVDQMRAALDLALPAATGETAAAIDGFLSAELRRFRTGGGTLPEEAPLPVWVQRCHEIFEAWSQAGENPADHADLDRIARELAVAAPAFEALVTIACAAGPARALASETLAAAQADALGLQDALEGLQDRFDAGQAELMQTAAALEASQAALEAQRAEHAQEIADVSARAAGAQQQLRGELQSVRQQRAQLTSDLAAARKALSDAERVLADLQAGLGQVTADRDAARQAHRQASTRAQHLQHRLEAALSRSAALEHANILMSQSTSWRVTRPMRRLSQLIRPGPRGRSPD